MSAPRSVCAIAAACEAFTAAAHSGIAITYVLASIQVRLLTCGAKITARYKGTRHQNPGAHAGSVQYVELPCKAQGTRGTQSG